MINPAPPTAPAATAQPIPAAWNGPPASKAAASMATTPAGAEITTTDKALARRDATPPRKSALPYSAAAARANAINTADPPLSVLPPHPVGMLYRIVQHTDRPSGRREIIRGHRCSRRCARAHRAVAARR